MWDQFLKDNAGYIIPGIFGLIGIIIGALAAFAPSLLNRGLTRANENHTDAETAQIFTDLAEKAIAQMTKIHSLEMSEQNKKIEALEKSLSNLEKEHRKLKEEHEKLSSDFDKLLEMELLARTQRDVYRVQLEENDITPKV